MRRSVESKHLVILMLFLFMMINFADKAVIGLAGPNIMKAFNLTPVEFGFIGSAFFFLFAISGIGFGFLANRYDSHKIVTLLALIWALVQFPIVVSASYGVLLASRIILGFGEGPAYPLALHTGYQWFDNSERNLPGAIIQQGAPFGLAVSGPVLTYIIVYYNWQAAFVFLGVIGFIWVAVWWALGFAGRKKPPVAAVMVTEDNRSFSYAKVFSDPTFISILLLYFVEFTITALFFVWVPTYLTSGLEFSKIETGWIFSIVHFAGIPAVLVIAKVSGDMLKRGVSSRISRGLVVSCSAIIGGVFFMMLTTGISPIAKVVCLTIGTVLASLAFAFGPLMIAEISPSSRRGGLLGIMNSVNTLAGLIAPVAMGLFVQANATSVAAGYQRGFMLVGILLAITGLIGAICMNPERSRARLLSDAQPVAPTAVADGIRP